MYKRQLLICPTTFMLRVSFSPAPECVIVVLLESSFSDPRAAKNNCCCCYCYAPTSAARRVGVLLHSHCSSAHHTYAINLGIVQATMPAFIVVISMIWLKTKISLLQIFAILVTFLGVLTKNISGNAKKPVTARK